MKRWNQKGYTLPETIIAVIILPILLFIIYNIFSSVAIHTAAVRYNNSQLNAVQNIMYQLHVDLNDAYRVETDEHQLIAYNHNGTAVYKKDGEVLLLNGTKTKVDGTKISLDWEDVSEAVNGKNGKKILKITATYLKKFGQGDEQTVTMEKYILTDQVLE